MRIKRFLAASLKEAKEQIVRELGEDAVVLSSRQVRKPGIWGWLGFSQVEVTAAIDTPAINNPASPSPATSTAISPPWESLQQELMETKRMLEVVTKRLQSPHGQGLANYPQALSDYYSRLQDSGLAEALIWELCEDLRGRLSPEEIKQEDLIAQVGAQLLADRLVPYHGTTSTKPQIICLVGPTGVGKTTTIAKLAANLVLRRKQRAALVTFDTYRIAAVEQLRTYGEILGAPVEVALTPAEMRTKIQALQGYDVIFVDSVGRSQQNIMQLSELGAFLDAVEADEVFLTISSTTQFEVMREIVENYQPAKPTALVFTKLDEARRLGPLLNLLLATGLPVAYLTNGQDVPDDILQPTPRELISLLLGDKPA